MPFTDQLTIGCYSTAALWKVNLIVRSKKRALSDDFLEVVTEELHERFEIVHPTIQIERNLAKHGCDQL
jgi:hypothetical protein